jgi:hypothetical protein
VRHQEFKSALDNVKRKEQMKISGDDDDDLVPSVVGAGRMLKKKPLLTKSKIVLGPFIDSHVEASSSRKMNSMMI